MIIKGVVPKINGSDKFCLKLELNHVRNGRFCGFCKVGGVAAWNCIIMIAIFGQTQAAITYLACTVYLMLMCSLE